MAFTTDIKKSNINENWLFELEYYNGDTGGDGGGGFGQIFLSNGTTPLLVNGAIDNSQTVLILDTNTMLQIGDFIKIDSEIMEITAVIVSESSAVRIEVKRGMLGTTIATHSDNSTIFWNNYLGLAFSDYVYNERLYKGVILNKPTIRESINLFKSTSKRSNISIKIPDYIHKGLPISQELNKTHQYINRTCSIYSVINNSARVKIGSFRISAISTDGKSINISMATFQPWDGLKIPNVKTTTTGRYFPIVYGDFTGATSDHDNPAYIETMPNTVWPLEVDNSTFYFYCPIAYDLGSTATKLRYYEEGFNKFTPLEVKYDAEAYEGGYALKANTNLRRHYKFKAVGTIERTLVNPENATDGTSDQGSSDSFAHLNWGTVGTDTSQTGTITLNKDTSFEIPAFDDPPDKTSTSNNHGLTLEVVWQVINFYAITSGNDFESNLVKAIDLSVPGSETTLTNGAYLGADISDAQSAPGTTTTLRTSTKDMATLYSTSGGFPDGMILRFKREAKATDGSNTTTIHHDTDANRLKVYDFRFKATFMVDKFNTIQDGVQRIQNLKHLYSHSDGMQMQITGLSGTADDIQKAHLDLLNRFCDLDVASSPTANIDGYQSTSLQRNDWYIRWWCHKPKDLGKTLEQMQFEGCFIFRYKYDGEPQYIHIANSPSSILTLSKNDINNINLSISDPNEIVTKMNINYDIHPALKTYQFNVSSENSTTVSKYNIQSKENVRNIDLDMLVSSIGDANPVGENRNDNFISYQNSLFGDIYLNITLDIVNPSKWVDSSLNPIEVGDIIDFDNTNMFPETPMGFNSASWSGLNFVITEMKRAVGKLSIKARSV